MIDANPKAVLISGLVIVTNEATQKIVVRIRVVSPTQKLMVVQNMISVLDAAIEQLEFFVDRNNPSSSVRSLSSG